MRATGPVIALEDVERAARRLAGVAHRTPVVTSRTLDARTGATALLKAESLQRAGAFKFRGAYNRVASLAADERSRGVLSFSSGNHAQALALAARLHDTSATLVMPRDAPEAKLAATRGYGAEIVLYDRYTEDREAIGRALAEERGLVVVPPYDDPEVMAGQGTVALELIEDAGPLDLLLVCVGGGGLLEGCATVARALLGDDVRVVGVEPEAGDDTRRSLEAGHRVRIPVPRTIADGQQAETPGELTWEVNRRLVDEVVVVSDAEIVAAMAFAFGRLRLVLEPSGACALAALLAGRVEAGGLRVGVTLSGGNVGLERFAELVAGAGS